MRNRIGTEVASMTSASVRLPAIARSRMRRARKPTEVFGSIDRRHGANNAAAGAAASTMQAIAFPHSRTRDPIPHSSSINEDIRWSADYQANGASTAATQVTAIVRGREKLGKTVDIAAAVDVTRRA